MLLNLKELKKNDVMFVEAGQPHCYLRGIGFEIMPPSDNVVRCGLTQKKVDKEELMRIVSFAPVSGEHPFLLEILNG